MTDQARMDGKADSEAKIQKLLADANEWEQDAKRLHRMGDIHAARGAFHMAQACLEEAIEIEASHDH